MAYKVLTTDEKIKKAEAALEKAMKSVTAAQAVEKRRRAALEKLLLIQRTERLDTAEEAVSALGLSIDEVLAALCEGKTFSDLQRMSEKQNGAAAASGV